MLNKVVNDDFSAIAASDVALVDFNAVWCGPCRMVAPIVDELAAEYDGKVDFYSVDVDDNPVLAQRFGIMNIPTLMLLKKGVKAGVKVGFLPKEQLKSWIEENR